MDGLINQLLDTLAIDVRLLEQYRAEGKLSHAHHMQSRAEGMREALFIVKLYKAFTDEQKERFDDLSKRVDMPSPYSPMRSDTEWCAEPLKI